MHLVYSLQPPMLHYTKAICRKKKKALCSLIRSLIPTMIDIDFVVSKQNLL